MRFALLPVTIPAYRQGGNNEHFIKEFLKKVVTEEKRKTARIDIIAYHVFWPIAHVLSIPLIKRGVGATSVTKFSLISGNEACIRKMPIRTLQIDDVFDVNVFLKTYRFLTHRGE